MATGRRAALQCGKPSRTRPENALQRWQLTLALSTLLVLLSALQLFFWGAGEDGLRVVIRSSARSSVVLFAMSFAASSLHALWQSRPSRWLLANRRYVGVSYAVSHTIHALALLGLAGQSSEFVEGLVTVTLAGGGLAYLFTFAMAATSSDAALGWLGRRRWRMLHLIGGWYIWLIFAQSYLPRAARAAAYLPAGAIVLAVAGLRAARWVRVRRSRRHQRTRPTPTEDERHTGTRLRGASTKQP